MITFRRNFTGKQAVYNQLRGLTRSSVLTCKKDEGDGKDDKTESKEKAANKLNDILQLMLQQDAEEPKTKVHLAQAVKRKREKKPEKEKSLDEKLSGAAKEVAASLGGDAGKTESELLNILLRRTEPSTEGLNDLLKGLKVEREEPSLSRAQQVRDSLSRRPTDLSQSISVSAQLTPDARKIKKKHATHVNLAGAAPSSYFAGLQPHPPPCELRTWQGCEARDLRLAVTHPPSNIYEQMALWTNRGMLWKFPIDNEQGLEAEKQVSFEEHIFLENHLEGWCPEKGPIRHFMELVCVGLSKNHWLSVEEKKNYIHWYRDFFVDKKELVKEIGAGDIKFDSEKDETMQQQV